MTEEVELVEQSQDAAGYRRSIRANVRGLWAGILDYYQFYDGMDAAIRIYIPRAFYAGAAECDITPSELTPAERQEIERNIMYERQWIDGFAIAIEQGSKAEGGKIAPLYARAEIWIGRWEGIRSAAMAMVCADKKLEWVLGGAEEHCNSCVKLAGKIKRASYWNERGILPRVHGAPYLECQGFRCTCYLRPTDRHMSPGPLPRLP